MQIDAQVLRDFGLIATGRAPDAVDIVIGVQQPAKGCVQRRVFAVPLCVYVRPTCQQQIDGFYVAVYRRLMERRESGLRHQIDICPRVQEHLDDVRTAARGSLAHGIGIGAIGQQYRQHVHPDPLAHRLAAGDAGVVLPPIGHGRIDAKGLVRDPIPVGGNGGAQWQIGVDVFHPRGDQSHHVDAGARDGLVQDPSPLAA